MKKLILFLMTVVVFASCDPKGDIPDKGKLDPNAMISLRPAASVRSTVPGLTGLEVVQQALNIKWQSHWAGGQYWDDAKAIGRSFPEQQKDLKTPALLMLGIDVITQEGEYNKIFTHGFSVYITDANNDTIAYVPDAVINAARPLIEAAYEDENYTEVYRLFNEAFTFLPISE